MTKFIVEHLEPEVFDWNFLEYKHISQVVGKENLIFTNVKSDSDKEKLKDLGEVREEPVTEMMPKDSCVLDPGAEKTLSPDDKFEFIILGGILGDHPPKERTKVELTSKMPNISSRNLKDKQMSTDTAALVAKMIVDGTPFEDIDFIDSPDIEIEEGLSVNLPYRYVKKDGKPVLADGLMEVLEREESF